MNQSLPNRVWIELDLPADNTEGDERASKMCVMLKKLGCTIKKPVFWHSKKQRYCFTLDEGGGFVVAVDNGHWYNLDFFSKED